MSTVIPGAMWFAQKAVKPSASFPAWSPHWDVWTLILTLSAVYAILVLRLGPRLAPDPKHPVSRFQVSCFVLAMLATWIPADYPIHDIAEGSLFSVHMFQHLIFTMVAAPLLLLGTPAWLARWFLSPRWLFNTVRWLSRLLPAIIIYNVVLVFMHWPVVVDYTLSHHSMHLVAHVFLYVSAMIVWMPILSPLPEIPRLAPPMRLAYLFLQSVVPTIPASFLTFGSTPLYKYYEHVPHLFGLTTVEDQQMAGLIMKVGAGFLLWTVMAVIFFRWSGDEERHEAERRRERSLAAVGR